MKPDFMERTAKLIAEVRTVTFIDSYDAARIEVKLLIKTSTK